MVTIETVPALFGMVLVLVALGFKIAAVPFQIWVPDVYQGAPTPVTAFLSVGSKAAGFVVLLRVLQPFFMLPQMERALVVDRAADFDLWKSRRASANQSETPARLLEHRVTPAICSSASFRLSGVASRFISSPIW